MVDKQIGENYVENLVFRFYGRLIPVKNQPLLIWDFDGVLCDSLFECIEVLGWAIRNYSIVDLWRDHVAKSQEARGPAVRLALWQREFAKDPFDAYRLYSRMRHLRPYITKGQDYLWQYLFHSKFARREMNGSRYRQIFSDFFDPQFDQQLDRIFYNSRKDLAKSLKHRYFRLFRPYWAALHTFTQVQHSHRNYICTARDRSAVVNLLRYSGIQFGDQFIYAHDANGREGNKGSKKTEQIRMILELEGHQKKSFTLIEDQVQVPLELATIYRNMLVVYAAYGYGQRQDWEQARIDRLIVVSKPENLEQLFCKESDHAFGVANR